MSKFVVLSLSICSFSFAHSVISSADWKMKLSFPPNFNTEVYAESIFIAQLIVLGGDIVDEFNIFFSFDDRSSLLLFACPDPFRMCEIVQSTWLSSVI